MPSKLQRRNYWTAKIRFKRQYKPVGFGDPADPRTVDGKRRSAAQAAETRPAGKQPVRPQ
jgi:hypothetical protein